MNCSRQIFRIKNASTIKRNFFYEKPIATSQYVFGNNWPLINSHTTFDVRMGCKLTKLASPELAEDAFHRPPPLADPRCPLTTKQQYCMLASWKGIYRQIEKTGIILFVKLFEENKELLALFTKFSELHTAEHQLSSTELAEHASKVMHTLDEGVKALRDIDGFMTYVRHVGATHHQVDGFQASNFWKIEQPFLEAAKTTLGERYTPNIENIYQLTIRFILENLVKGYEDADPRNQQTDIDLNK